MSESNKENSVEIEEKYLEDIKEILDRGGIKYSMSGSSIEVGTEEDMQYVLHIIHGSINLLRTASDVEYPKEFKELFNKIKNNNTDEVKRIGFQVENKLNKPVDEFTNEELLEYWYRLRLMCSPRVEVTPDSLPDELLVIKLQEELLLRLSK